MTALRPEIVLIRHGRTEANEEERLMGWSDSSLTQDAVCEANELARSADVRALARSVTAVYSSDLGRALHTARIVATALHAPVHSSEALRERSFGSWEKRRLPELRAEPAWPRVELESDVPAPAGECLRQVERRLFGFVLSLHRRHDPHESIVLVGHSTAWRLLTAALGGRRGFPLAEPIPPCLSLIRHPRETARLLVEFE